MRCKGTRRGTHRSQTIRTAGEGAGQNLRAALWNTEVVEVHIVIDIELLPIQAGKPADAPVRVGADAKLVALMLVVDEVTPTADRSRALDALGAQLREVGRIEVGSLAADTGIGRAHSTAHVVRIVLLAVNVTDHIAAGINDTEQVADLAVDGPGRAFVPILGAAGMEGGDLVLAERGPVRAGRIRVEVP